MLDDENPAPPSPTDTLRRKYREVLTDVLDDHRRGESSRDCIEGVGWVWACWCDCGWHGVGSDHQAHVADALIASGAVVDTATLTDLLPAECWVLRSARADVSCVSLVGGTFPNGGEWTEEMCCLPCRVAAALLEREAQR